MRFRSTVSLIGLSLALSCAVSSTVSVGAAEIDRVCEDNDRRAENVRDGAQFAVDGTSIAAAQNTQAASPSNEQFLDDLQNKLTTLMSEFYSKAKLTRSGNKIKVEYKVRPFIAAGNKQELAPDFGGVMCDIELKPGKYSGRIRLPQQYNEHNFYSVILMAPYSKELNAHLYVKLLYPSDTQQEFTDRFKDLLNEFDEPPETRSSSASPAAATSASPTSTNAEAPRKAVLTNVTPSGPPVEAIETSSQNAASPKQIFWKAQRGSETAYIVGTIPFRQSSSKALTMVSEIKDAYKQSKAVIVDTIDLKTSLPYSEKTIRYVGDDSLSKHLSAESKEAMDRFLNWSGESIDMYEFWKPWLVALAMENSSYRLNGFDRVDWEKFIAERAKKDSKPLFEMESAENKAKLFENLSDDDQNRLLRLAIKELMEFESIQKDAETAWRSGDAQKLDEALNRIASENADYKSVFDAVKRERAIQLSKKIDEEVKRLSPVFVAVDAGNLLGDNGLINQLSQAGFSVEQVSSSAGADGGKSADVASDTTVPSFGSARLSRYTYPEGKFSVLLPGKPSTKYTSKTGMRQVEYIYQDTQGAYCVGYIILPGVLQASAIPAAFDATSKGLTTSYKALESKQSPATLQGYPGRIINITKIKDKNDWGVHIRMFVVGKMLYILAAEGTSAWLRSPAVHQVSNSLTVVTPSDELKARQKQLPTQLWATPPRQEKPHSSSPTPLFDTGPGKNRGSSRGKSWGGDPYGPTSPYHRNRHNWGGNN